MANLNKVMLIGNCTRDIEARHTPKGTAIAEMGLAINRTFKGDDGEKREETTFVDVTLFGRRAEVAAQYLKKGSPVFIEGRLQLDSWEDKQSGQKRSKLKVIADAMEFLGGGKGKDDVRSERRTPEPPRRPSAPPSSRPAPTRDDDDDIPF